MLSVIASAEVDWRFAHPGADMLMGFNLKSLATSAAGAPLREMLTAKGGLSADRLQMLESIEEVYVSVRTKYVKGRPAAEPLGVILVIGNFENSAVMKLLEKQANVSARFIDRRTILLGDEESMTSAVERLKGDDGLVSPVVTRAKELAAGNDFWLVGSPAPLNSMKPKGSFKRQGGMLGDVEDIFDNLRSFSMGLAFRDEIALDLGLNLRTKAAADRLVALYQRLEADMQKTPAGQKSWAELAKSLEVHPNGTSVRFFAHASMPALQAAMTQALTTAPVQVAEQKPVPAALPARVAVVPVRRTVRVYGMESGYLEIPTGGSR